MCINNCNLTLYVLTKSFQGKLRFGVIGMNVSKYIFEKKKNPSHRSLLCRSDLETVAVVLSFDLPWLLSVLFPLFKTETLSKGLFQLYAQFIIVSQYSGVTCYKACCYPSFIGYIFLFCRLQDNISRTYFWVCIACFRCVIELFKPSLKVLHV